MLSAQTAIERDIPPLPFAVDDYWQQVKQQPCDQFAVLWAIRWLLHIGTESNLARQWAEVQIMSDPWYLEEAMDQLGSFALEADERDRLDDPHVFSNSGLVIVLMTPVDEDVQILPSEPLLGRVRSPTRRDAREERCPLGYPVAGPRRRPGQSKVRRDQRPDRQQHVKTSTSSHSRWSPLVEMRSQSWNALIRSPSRARTC
ncbi:hypothetical protein DPSP01_001927 [Paraphaeosphaeria sporulosa]